MTFGEAIQSGIKNYADFSGRTPRSGYWWWTLFMVLLSIGSQILIAIVAAMGSVVALIIIIPVCLALLALIVPTLAVVVRRLHDIDKSGWWFLLCLVPLVGSIILIVWYCTKGTDGPNRFGDDPLANAPRM